MLRSMDDEFRDMVGIRLYTITLSDVNVTAVVYFRFSATSKVCVSVMFATAMC